MEDAPRIVTELPGPSARELIERDRRVTSPSLARAYPFVPARGAGCVIEDVDGNRFLDFNAGIAVASTGHAHPAVVEAIRRQAGELCGSEAREEREVEERLGIERRPPRHGVCLLLACAWRPTTAVGELGLIGASSLPVSSPKIHHRARGCSAS